MTFECLGVYGYFKDGILPVEGGLYDQSAVFVKAMSVLKHEFHQRQEVNRKRRGRGA